MARLNVYVPDELTPLIDRWRDQVNLSEVCTAALRDSLEAMESGRSARALLARLFSGPTPLERELATLSALHRVIIAKSGAEEDVRDTIARGVAAAMDRTIADGQQLAIGGGRQMWSVVRCLSPRSVRVGIAAVGVGQVDPRVLHAHPNTLVTLLSLLYAPRARATLVGSREFTATWGTVESSNPSEGSHARELSRIIVGSCAPFDSKSSYAELLGERGVDALAKGKARGDFLGVFLDAKGRVVPHEAPPSSSLLSADALRENAGRRDTMVMLAAAGDAKIPMIRLVLEAGMCNALVTDERTAKALLK